MKPWLAYETKVQLSATQMLVSLTLLCNLGWVSSENQSGLSLDVCVQTSCKAMAKTRSEDLCAALFHGSMDDCGNLRALGTLSLRARYPPGVSTRDVPIHPLGTHLYGVLRCGPFESASPVYPVCEPDLQVPPCELANVNREQRSEYIQGTSGPRPPRAHPARIFPWWAAYLGLEQEALQGAGTAIGELPPYFMARAARLSGAEPDDEEYQEFEEMLEHAQAAQKRLSIVMSFSPVPLESCKLLQVYLMAYS
ncbi:UNVERIFIED_CONTAM: hypothetical protein K2H54_033982 [Gekko kuhli]